MRGKDEETGEFYSPSRSEQRRAALDVLELGGKLAVLSDAQLSKLPIPEHLLPHILETRRITSHIAHKRQLQFLAKQMRREDEDTLDAIRDALDEKGDAARREVAAMHRVEAWRAAFCFVGTLLTTCLVAIPIPAVDWSGGDESSGQVVIVTPEDRIEIRSVKLGLQNPASVQVLSGLRAGELVVTSNRSGLEAGQRVRPRLTEIAAETTP